MSMQLPLIQLDVNEYYIPIFAEARLLNNQRRLLAIKFMDKAGYSF